MQHHLPQDYKSASTRHKGKEIAKPITPQSESVSVFDEDSDPEQAQRDIGKCKKNLAILAKRSATNGISALTVRDMGHMQGNCTKPKRVNGLHRELEAHYATGKDSGGLTEESSSIWSAFGTVQKSDESNVYDN
ncbi:hypothetical protein Tco_1554269 [Tanacetum coccineum]